jgi:sigma-E factor negative regulatory protein RseA
VVVRVKTRLSELIDGELEAREARAVFDAVKRDAELRTRWQEYQLIGDILRGEKSLGSDVTARVMAGLDDEPVVLAPQRQRQPWQRRALALAATLAGVAAVGWVALGPQSDSTPVERTAQASAPAPQAAQDAADMREYLVAHQTQSSSLQFRGGAENIRTVATAARSR